MYKEPIQLFRLELLQVYPVDSLQPDKLGMNKAMAKCIKPNNKMPEINKT